MSGPAIDVSRLYLLSGAWIVAPHWPTLEEVNRHIGFIHQFPEYFWIILVVGLFLIAMRHAKDRQLREQAQFSEEQGWSFSKDWSPISEEDWLQLSRNANLAALSLASSRKNFTFGTHRGTTFALFEAPGGVRARDEERTPETMIAFQKPPDLPAAPSVIAGGGIGAWERFVTDKWVFFRPNPPQWVIRGPQAKAFVDEAYAQLRGI